MIRYQRRKYKLVNTDNGNSIILDGQGTNYEPRNWDNSERELKRSVKNFSITTVLSKDLEFTGSGANFLISAYNSKGIEANVNMIEYRYDTENSEPYIYSVGDFDFSDYTREKNIVKVPFNSGGLNSLLKSKLNDKFELNRTESITGETIEPLELNEFEVINRPLLLDSKLETKKDNENTSRIILPALQASEVGIQTDITYESDDNIKSIIPEQVNNNLNKGFFSTLFYENNNVDRVFELSIELKMKVVFYVETLFNASIDLVIYENGEDLDVKQRIEILDLGDVNNGETIIVDTSYVNSSFSLMKGESMSIQLVIPSASFSPEVELKEVMNTIKIKENSVRDDLPRRANFIFNKDIGSRFMNIINNDKSTYYSDFFNTSEFKLTGVTTGKYIRGFSDSKITTSFKNFLDNAKSVYGMSYNIEVVDGKETLVHEPLKHFFRSETKIKIPKQVNNLKRSVAKEFVYNNLKTGYKKPSGDNLYEEVNGLNEFNTSNEYITPITRIQQDYDTESPYRADSEGKELTLRKSIKTFPTEDYRSDNTIFNLDLKDVGTNVYAERVWQDDYEEAPKNIFSPDTATGLRLTPFRNLQRHFWFLNSAFTKFTNKYIRYSSTRGNSELITKKSGEEEVAENGDFKINTLENAIFVSEWIEFEYPVNTELLKQVEGFTTVNGRKIPNIYFKVEFINEFNKKETGYLFNFKPLKEGKWKLLKAL